jgi:hypothetical protein
MQSRTLAFGGLALLVLLAGCFGGFGGTSTPTPTATREPCTEHVEPTVNPDRDAVTPSPMPERPAATNRSSVLAYIEEYEQAYKRNRGLEANTETYEVSILESNVSETERGYVVRLKALWWYNAGGPVEGPETATLVHADGPRYDVAYLLADDRLRRAEGAEADPATGPDVECWG